MQWSDVIREELKIKISSINIVPKKDNEKGRWQKTRNKILTKNNHTCRYCGGKYMKYLICVHMDNDISNFDIDNLDMCCRACYLITHINGGFNQEMGLYTSSLSQKDIVRKTVDHIINCDDIPNIEDIDPHAKKIPLSIAEYCNLRILEHPDVAKLHLDNYKVFFLKRFDTTFIMSNIYTTKSMFIDDKSSKKNKHAHHINIENYVFSKEEKEILTNCLIK
jgi:hypothetical protein